MKTLSEAVQVQIINEAGSTYRNVFLGLVREGHGFSEAEQQMKFASDITNRFVDDIVKKLKEG